MQYYNQVISSTTYYYEDSVMVKSLTDYRLPLDNYILPFFTGFFIVVIFLVIRKIKF